MKLHFIQNTKTLIYAKNNDYKVLLVHGFLDLFLCFLLPYMMPQIE